MKINRYQAKNLRTAIDKARADLGPEAKVIHVRQVGDGSPNARRNSDQAFDKSLNNKGNQENTEAETGVEIIAAIDDDKYDEAEASETRNSDASPERELPAQNAPAVTARQLGAKAYATQVVKAAEAKIAALQDSSDSISPKAYTKPRIDNDYILQGLQDCCSKNQVSQDITYEILSLLNDSQSHNMGQGKGNVAPAWKARESTETEPFGHWLPKCPRDYMSLFMSRRIRVSGGLDMSRKTAILIGPTGVGKTTTLAKLAAQYRFQQGMDVGLITIDAYRIAAIDQLRTYAQIMSIPLKVALTPEELEKCIRDYKDMDVILVDTPGRSPLNTGALNSLQDFLEAAQPADTHLLIALSMKESDAYMVTEKFVPQYVRQLIFTKIDETSSFGPILGVCRRMEKPVSYLTTGQNVPDDIEIAQTERMVDLFIDA